jgi:hypothetical protein
MLAQGSEATLAATMRRPLLVAALLLALPATALAIDDGRVGANLDGDARAELLEPEKVADSYGYEQVAYRIDDLCEADHVMHHHRLHSPQDNAAVQVAETDGDRERPEVRIVASSGASGRAGIVEVVRLTDQPAGGCPQPSTLLLWSSTNPRPRAPKGWAVASFGVRYRAARPGSARRDVVITDHLAGPEDSYARPSRKRVTRWRYDREPGRYVIASSRITRLR